MELMKLLLHGDCLEKLKVLKDNSIDSIVTDPPYGLSFMNKKWDYDVPSTDIWVECLRVLKPGGHLLSFSGSRTYHRMVVRIEDAGFEVRDQIMWVYGSGFPKSHNIGKAVDKLQGNDREVVAEVTTPFKVKGKNDDGVTWNNKTFCSKTDENGYRVNEVTKGTSEWEGWGTALKPAHEPIVMARKPLSEKTVAENVLKWGTGGINIDDSRIGIKEGDKTSAGHRTCNIFEEVKTSGGNGSPDYEQHELGRWPANIIFDEEAGQVLDEQSGISKGKIGMTQQSSPNKIYGEFKSTGDIKVNDGKTDKGGASRFYYCPKASKKDRDEGLEAFTVKKIEGRDSGQDERNVPFKNRTNLRSNTHPTVKPTALMLYLIKLVTPVNGTVLDCFLGSGSTGKAAIRGGFNFVGIEREKEYIDIAEARINNELKDKNDGLSL
jgi:site-specific DNA-methyltransferase (adenine-specific)